MKKPNIVLCILGYLWSSPMTLFGVVFALLYVPKTIRWSEGCLEIVPLWILGNPGAQTWGCIIFYCHENTRRDLDLRVHERVHVVQAFMGGVFFGLAYGINWLWLFLVRCPEYPLGTPRWFRAYMGIFFERVAYRRQAEFVQGLRSDAWGSWLLGGA